MFFLTLVHQKKIMAIMGKEKSGKSYFLNGTIGSFLIKVEMWLISHTATSGTK